MTSIKCKQCGLINFASDTQCKRCQSSISNLSPITAERSYQSKIAEFQNPPPPKFYNSDQPQMQAETYCLKCGTKGNLSMKTFQKKYTSPVAALGIFIGILPYFLLKHFLTTTHDITAPFCEECQNKFTKASKLSQISYLVILASIFLGIVAATILDSYLALFMIIGTAIIFWIYAAISEKSATPKVKKIDSKQVTFNTPTIGEICFEK